MKGRFTAEENRMIDYLLGRLPEGEREEIAEQALADDETWMSLLAMEETLIDGYVRGKIEATEARLIEDTILATGDGQARLRMARAFLERQRRARPVRKHSWWLPVAAAVLLTMVGAGLLYRAEPPSRPASQSTVQLATIVLDPRVFRDPGLVAFAISLPKADRAERYTVHVKLPNGTEYVCEAREVRNSQGCLSSSMCRGTYSDRDDMKSSCMPVSRLFLGCWLMRR
jgi:hypothetical protein